VTRDQFRDNARKFLLMAQMLASFTPTNRDDQAVALLMGVVSDDAKFQQLCDVIGLPADAPTK
jgi:hypothetical protein